MPDVSIGAVLYDIKRMTLSEEGSKINIGPANSKNYLSSDTKPAVRPNGLIRFSSLATVLKQ
jgi:hypothetical protein